MRTKTILLISLVAFGTPAVVAENLAAIYVALGVHAILYVLHVLEVKLHKLLDHYGIVIPDYEIAKT